MRCFCRRPPVDRSAVFCKSSAIISYLSPNVIMTAFREMFSLQLTKTPQWFWNVTHTSSIPLALAKSVSLHINGKRTKTNGASKPSSSAPHLNRRPHQKFTSHHSRVCSAGCGVGGLQAGWGGYRKTLYCIIVELPLS